MAEIKQRNIFSISWWFENFPFLVYEFNNYVDLHAHSFTFLNQYCVVLKLPFLFSREKNAQKSNSNDNRKRKTI